MNNPILCPICNVQASFSPVQGGLKWICPRCGEFSLTGSAEAELRNVPLKTPSAVSGWIRYQNSLVTTPNINSQELERVRTFIKPTFRERAEQYLATIVAKNPKLNARFAPTTEELVGASYSEDDGEVAVIFEFLKEKQFIKESPGGQPRVSAEGRIAAEELRHRRTASSQAFVALWFDKEMEEAQKKGLVPAIESAGYEAMIISNKEHANKIDDEIIAEIRNSKFLVADFTGQRGGVYFEAGFAMGLGLPVIWTCRHDHLSKLHFDIRQYNCIDWQDASDLAIRLQRRIEALLGKGPKRLI